ncbi:MAG: ElyC/SanA/YdcF family protein [Bacteroidia bacterium]
MKVFKLWIRRFFRLGLSALFLVGIGLWFSNSLIESNSEDFIIHGSSQVPHARVGLLLGTSKYNRSGNPNLFFRYRIEAAAELFKTGKVDYLLVSGDNRTLSYNEPRDMRKALLKRGIPDSAIYMDFAGLRTFDSVLRCKQVFGQQSFIIISQRFHLERALFIAHNEDIQAVGFAARDVNDPSGWTSGLREVFARSRAVLDVYLLNTKPRFLGEPVQVGPESKKMVLDQKENALPGGKAF